MSSLINLAATGEHYFNVPSSSFLRCSLDHALITPMILNGFWLSRILEVKIYMGSGKQCCL